MDYPPAVTRVFNDLGIPPGDRQAPFEFVLDTGHTVALRQGGGRWFLCGFLNELPLGDGAEQILEGLIEDPFNARDCGCLCHEPAGGRLLYWTEILPAAAGSPPTPDVQAFLREVSDWARKVSQAGAL